MVTITKGRAGRVQGPAEDVAYGTACFQCLCPSGTGPSMEVDMCPFPGIPRHAGT